MVGVSSSLVNTHLSTKATLEAVTVISNNVDDYQD
jgi:hypothetical protein